MIEKRGAIPFAEKVLGLLEEGRFTATYKYAVLLGLLDLVIEQTERTGAPPDSVTTRQFAEKVLEIYWPQTRPFARSADTRVLVQNVRGQAEILGAIATFRVRQALDPVTPLWEARRAAPDRFERLVREVEWKLIEMPLPRLQVIGTAADEFIYTIGWDTTIRREVVRLYQERRGSSFDNRLLLKPGVGAHLRQLNGLLRPFIHRQWAVMVAKLNRHDESALEDFLFGIQRELTGRVRRAIWDVQHGACFYCRAATRVDAAELDHFIPWARYPDNGIDNLVLVDRACNGAKRAFLAAAEHVRRWVPRLHAGSPEDHNMEVAANAVGWLRQRPRTLGVARAIYVGVPPGTKLWLRGRSFIDADPKELSPLFS